MLEHSSAKHGIASFSNVIYKPYRLPSAGARKGSHGGDTLMLSGADAGQPSPMPENATVISPMAMSENSDQPLSLALDKSAVKPKQESDVKN